MRKAVHVAFACFLLLSVAHVGLAQNTNSSDIRGTVTDSSGAVLPGATVTVKNNDTGVVREFVTNGDGLYDPNSPIRLRVLHAGRPVTLDDAWWDRIVEVNLTGAYNMTIRAARHMCDRRTGVIINLSSGGASRTGSGHLTLVSHCDRLLRQDLPVRRFRRYAGL